MRRVLLLIVVALAWATAVAVSLSVAARTKVGPVVVQLSPTHGVHVGDVAAVAVGAAFATAVTLALRPLRA